MSAKKKAAVKKTGLAAGAMDLESFYDPDSKKMLPSTKVKRVLQAMGADPNEFYEHYRVDTARGPAGPRTPTEEEVKAVEAFTKTGDLTALMKALDTENRQTALMKVGAVTQWKAQQ